MTHILVAANGTIDDTHIPRRLTPFDPQHIIGANGGTRHLLALGLQPDTVIGDLDSLPADLLDRLREEGVTLEEHSPDKDETDLELALLYAVNHFTDPYIVIIGAAGQRIDMTLANLLLLSHEALRPAHIEIWRRAQTLRLLNPPSDTFHGSPGDTLSLIPLNGDVNHITTRGLKYALSNGTLTFGPARGVSNIMTAEEAAIAFESGLLAAIHTPGKA